MKEECIICKAPLEYLIEDTEMECAICHKKELSKTRCVNGHYVCNTCHMQGLDAILGVCLAETSKNPIEIMNKLMDLPFCHMHGPEHHIMVGSAYRIQKRRRRYFIRQGIDRNEKQGQERSGRRLRILGSMRSRYQLRNVCFHYFRFNSARKG